LKLKPKRKRKSYAIEVTANNKEIARLRAALESTEKELETERELWNQLTLLWDHFKSEPSEDSAQEVQRENERLRNALEMIRIKAGSHTVHSPEWAKGNKNDPGFAGIFAVADEVLQSPTR
jgi:hypothetical protein